MEIILLIYVVWAVYSGWKFMDGRFAVLEQKGILYKIIKFIGAWMVGMVYGAIYLIILIFRFLGLMSRM